MAVTALLGAPSINRHSATVHGHLTRSNRDERKWRKTGANQISSKCVSIVCIGRNWLQQRPPVEGNGESSVQIRRCPAAVMEHLLFLSQNARQIEQLPILLIFIYEVLDDG